MRLSVLVLSLFCATGASAGIFSQPSQHQEQKVSNLPNFTKLMQSEGPKVVNISALHKTKTDSNPLELLKKYFQEGEEPDDKKDESKKSTPSIGSGFFISNDGYLLTNAHVVSKAEGVTVKTTDRKEYEAKVIGVDVRTDIALLKIDAKTKPVKFADMNKVNVGEWVAAVGSPFGFDNTITAGIISAKQRFLSDSNYLPFIQSDVAINPGNSGGPLFNIYGEVVAINTQIYTKSGGYMGMSFSISIDEAVKIAEQLVSKGKVERSRIGVRIDTVKKDTAEALGLKVDEGLLVLQVEPGTPADKAGLRTGDVIIEKDGKKFTTLQEITQAIAETKDGAPMNFTVLRGADTLKLSIEAMDDLVMSELQTKNQADKLLNNTVLGIEFEGNRITKLSPDAKSAGLQIGDKVFQIGYTQVKNTDDMIAVLEKSQTDKKIGFFFQRDKTVGFITLKIE